MCVMQAPEFAPKHCSHHIVLDYSVAFKAHVPKEFERCSAWCVTVIVQTQWRLQCYKLQHMTPASSDTIMFNCGRIIDQEYLR